MTCPSAVEQCGTAGEWEPVWTSASGTKVPVSTPEPEPPDTRSQTFSDPYGPETVSPVR
ncbi:hypothetical protein [Actinacidiphila sp. ITFR-21]|uniref:hypothetical protein n=1 Tax=Actinacidiphila sp. ITFR-21 TaxID=3075199 RepID=UPI00288B19A4|nr:hypothetical protein [Streptomyces sp. ITFR-21]WNI14372.1 hypothetical protein RLT57_01680 [Streptomyces sp. ITFR-21]